MKKMFKIFSIFCTNIILFIGLFLVIDYSIYYIKIYKNIPYDQKQTSKYTLFPKVSFYNINHIFNGNTDKYNNTNGGRLPDGIEYSDKSPIVIFGCSYAFGYSLKYNQNFSYKLHIY